MNDGKLQLNELLFNFKKDDGMLLEFRQLNDSGDQIWDIQIEIIAWVIMKALSMMI